MFSYSLGETHAKKVVSNVRHQLSPKTSSLKTKGFQRNSQPTKARLVISNADTGIYEDIVASIYPSSTMRQCNRRSFDDERLMRNAARRQFLRNELLDEKHTDVSSLLECCLIYPKIPRQHFWQHSWCKVSSQTGLDSGYPFFCFYTLDVKLMNADW